MTEAVLQKATLDLARLFGWRVARFPMLNLGRDGQPRKLAYDTAGFPDAILTRLGRVIFAEFKTETGKLSEAQIEWQKHLDINGDYRCWRPADWHSGAIEQALR